MQKIGITPKLSLFKNKKDMMVLLNYSESIKHMKVSFILQIISFTINENTWIS